MVFSQTPNQDITEDKAKDFVEKIKKEKDVAPSFLSSEEIQEIETIDNLKREVVRLTELNLSLHKHYLKLTDDLTTQRDGGTVIKFTAGFLVGAAASAVVVGYIMSRP